MITQRRLQHLLALAQHVHFGRAAQSLHISQPALTKSIQALEAELGVTLLDRQRGAVALTAFGELVAQRGKSWLTAEEDLRREIAMLASNDIGSLRVALGPYPGLMSGFSSAARLMVRHPTIRISVREASWFDVLKWVHDQSVDLGITEVSGQERWEDFTTEVVGRHPGYFFCRPSHPLLRSTPVTLPQLLEFPWVSPRIADRVASMFPKMASRAGTFDPATGDFIPSIEIDVLLHAAQFLKDSDAIALATLTAMEQPLRSGEVVALTTLDRPLHTQYGFIYLKNRSLPPAAMAYMQEVRAVESEVWQREIELAAQLGLKTLTPAAA